MRRKEIAAIQHAAWLKGSLDQWRMKVAGLWEEWGALTETTERKEPKDADF